VHGTLVRLCEAVGSAFFGVLYDPCNLMQAGTDYRAALETFGPHITHVHLKDGFAAAGGEWERCELGKGEIDFGWVRAAAPPPTPPSLILAPLHNNNHKSREELIQVKSSHELRVGR